MKLTVTNTLTKRREPFAPIEPGKVGIYACGVTVYDACHIGHAMQALIYDVMRAYFRYQGLDVLYVRNYTDVDDKIIARAAELGVDALTHSENMIRETLSDLALLDIQPADVEPKVSEHIPEIIAMIETLIENGSAYASDGDVYYRVSAYEKYGCLSNRSPEEMRAGARVEVNPKKRDPMDFTLWKQAKEGEVSWPSPWGEGRPGWHIECSALAMKYLGETFDIHGGGKDLIFPHHENEIAQSEQATGKPFARYWIHNGLVTVEGRKMSKSLGNFMTIKEAVEKYYPETIRYTILRNHYSSNIDFSDQSFYDAYSRLIYFYTTLRKVDEAAASFPDATESPEHLKPPAVREKFEQAMNDDFNTTVAIAGLGEAFKWVNDLLAAKKPKMKQKIAVLKSVVADLRACMDVLGLLRKTPAEGLAAIQAYLVRDKKLDTAEIEGLIADRVAARAAKDWARADEIRETLEKRGISVMDSPEGTTWQVLP